MTLVSVALVSVALVSVALVALVLAALVLAGPMPLLAAWTAPVLLWAALVCCVVRRW